MPRRIPNISKVNKQIGFQPEMDLDGILKSVIDFHSGQQAPAKSTTAA
jgi:hypothetical protein